MKYSQFFMLLAIVYLAPTLPPLASILFGGACIITGLIALKRDE